MSGGGGCTGSACDCEGGGGGLAAPCITCMAAANCMKAACCWPCCWVGNPAAAGGPKAGMAGGYCWYIACMAAAAATGVGK